MIYIISALKAEANFLIEHFKLLKTDDKRFLIYQNSDIKLIISGISKLNSAIATTYLLSKSLPTKSDKVINIGLAGARSDINLGELFEVEKIINDSKVYHLKTTTKLKKASISCLDHVATKGYNLKSDLVDMESFGFYKASKIFSKNIVILKVVSDHLSDKILSNQNIDQLFLKHIKSIEDIMWIK